MDDFILEAIKLEGRESLDKLAKTMRSATPEEMTMIDEKIKEISCPTGMNFWEMCQLEDNDICEIVDKFNEVPNVNICRIEDIMKGIEMMEAKEIKIKYHNKDIEKLTYIDGKSDWIDLRAAEDVVMKAGEFKLISLGVAMKLPEGYEAHIVPRSSTFKNFGIIQTNHQAVIDNTYCGDNDIWKYPAYALRDTEIHVNDRICQFRIVENQPQIRFKEVWYLEGKDRGGIGSTGKQ